jgi:NHL repeat
MIYNNIVRNHTHWWIIRLLVVLAVFIFYNFTPYRSGQSSTVDSLNISLRGASGISVGPDGNIYIIERGGNKVIRCSNSGGSYKIDAEYSWKDAADNYPRDIVSVNGLDVYIADYNNHRILRFDRDLNLVSAFPSDEQISVAERPFGYPISLGVDRFGSIYVLDGENKRIVKIGKSNEVERTFGGYGAGAGRVKSPSKIRVSSSDLVFVQDENCIVVFDIFGNYIRTIGTALFTKLTTFASDRDMIYALDGCRVFIIGKEGVPKDTILVRQAIPGYECTEIVGMDAKQGGLYLLNEHSLFIPRIGKTSIRGN